MILEKLIKDGKCSTHPHNVFLEFASELGLIGIIFLLFKITYIFYLLFQKLFENKNYSYSNVANIIFILSYIDHISFCPLVVFLIIGIYQSIFLIWLFLHTLYMVKNYDHNCSYTLL